MCPPRRSPQRSSPIRTPFEPLYRQLYDKLRRHIRHLKGVMSVTKPEAGMHTIGWLTGGLGDGEASRRAADAGVVAWALSSCYRDAAHAAPAPGLILGFAAYNKTQISDAVRTLARVLA